jgi:prolyl-tRNA synthetase
MTFEVLMPDGKALQSCTSHFLGQNFSTSFDIKFQNENGKLEKVWQSTWGLSTRALGAVLMVHGDDKGLILPPKIAPEQVVVIPIFKEGETSQKIQATELILQALSKAGYSDVIVDMDTKTSVGWKFNQYELFGVPLRIEIGSKEFKEKKATLVRRDTGERSLVSLSKLGLAVNDILADIQDSLFELANAFLKQNTYEIADYEEFKNVIENKRGFIYSPWCESEKCEAKVKEETKATIRCLPLKQPEKSPNRCLVCGKKATVWAVFARSY